jgi:predicted homoserine dehydrogenase-like protein
MNALPIALSEGCVLRRDIAKDDVICFGDVDAIAEGVVWKLWQEQNARWPVAISEAQESLPQPASSVGVR